MESLNGGAPTYAGQIKAHNLHLLMGDDDNGGTNMNGTGYAGTTGQNAPTAQRPRTAESHSSEDSRQMDQSPTGNQSDDSLEAEMKYQEELKERLRKSFADLGMNPEGVLRDSLEDGDDELRDSLDYPPQHNPLNRDGTFVKDPEDQNDTGAAGLQYDPQFQDSLDATQDDNNNKFDDNDLPLQDSLDATDHSKTDQNEPTSQDLMGYDKTIDNHMLAYPVVDSTLKSNRQLSGGSQHSNNNHGGSNSSSRRNSRDSGKGSYKVSTGSTHVRLKDSPSHKKPPSGLSNGSQRSSQQERKSSGRVNSRPKSRDSGSGGSNRSATKPVPIPGITTSTRENTPVKSNVREPTRPKLPKTQSEIHRLENGEEVRVEYISDDSDDENMHFVDEKGSPVDNFGVPLVPSKEDSSLRRQYRIKPIPPKDPSPREQQALNARRTSSGVTKAPHSSNEPVNETVTRTHNEQLGLLESTKPPVNDQTVTQQEPLIQRTQAQQLGIQDRTLPPSSHSPTDRLDSSKNTADSSKQPSVFGEVRISSHTKDSGLDSAQNSASGQRGDRDPDPYDNLRFDMQAVKQAAAEQEAALRFQNSSGSKDRQGSSNNRNNSGNGSRENRLKQSPDGNAEYPQQNGHKIANSDGHYQQQQLIDQYNAPPREERRPFDDRQPSENAYHTPHISSGYSQRSDMQPQFRSDRHNGGQSWQGSASSSIRQPAYGGQSAANQHPQYDMTQNFQPIRTQEPLVQQVQHFQNPPIMDPTSNPQLGYQQQSTMDPRTSYPHPMQSGVGPNSAPGYHQGVSTNPHHPVQSRFDPSLSSSYQQPNDMHIRQPLQQPQQQWQNLQPGYSQGLPQNAQPIPQPSQHNMYAQHAQGPVPFNQGGLYQQAGPIQNMQYQQPQLHEQYQAQQVAPAPQMDQYSNYPMHGNGPYQINQQPQAVDSYHQMPNSQPPYQEQQPPQAPHLRQAGGPTYSQPAQQQPMRTGPDFISRNKQYLRYGAPKRTYQDLYQLKKDTHTQTPPLNPHKPLPSISRENSQEVGNEMNVFAEPDDEAWTRQLVEEQKQMALLMRGQSDTNLTSGMPGVQTYPPQGANPRNSQAHSSWSADHATAYARMQATQQPQQVSPRARVAFADEMYNSFESEDLVMSPRRGYNSHPNSKRTSPYPALPGISSNKKDRQSPLRTSDPDGYLVKLQKAKQGPQYKEYTLKDYRNLKKDVKMGGLGPDLDVASERQDKANRQRDYAKAVMQQNKKALQHAKNKPWRNKSTTPSKTLEAATKRNAAIEYAKNIPKPPLPAPAEEVHERLYGASSRQQDDHREAVGLEMARLEELKARHMKEKEEVDKLRTEIQT